MKTSYANDIIQYYLTGKSLADCSKRFGVSITTANKYVSNAGVSRTKAQAAKIVGLAMTGKPRPELRKEIPECVVDMYKTGMTTKGIAKELHICAKRIAGYLRDKGMLMTTNEKIVAFHSQDDRLKWCKKASAAAKESGGRKNPHSWAVTRSMGDFLIGEGEVELLTELRALGLDVSHQTPVGSYNIDITLYKLNIAIEVHRGSWHGRSDIRPERVEYLLNRGWKIIFVQTSRWGAFVDFPGIANKLVAYANVIRSDPSSPGQYGVLRRNGKPSSTLPDYFNRWSRIPGF
jgi:hypothetical protein